MLRAGGFGSPLEYYFPYDFEKRKQVWHEQTHSLRIGKDENPTPKHWFQTVLRRGAVKCTWDSHELLLKEAGEDMDHVDRYYVYLRRRNRLQQAVSWYRALQTRQWTSHDNCEKQPEYSREGISECLRWIAQHEERWEHWLSDTEHLRLFYEQITPATLDVIAAFAGMTRQRTRLVPTDYQILRDELTEEWMNRYLQGD